MAAMVNGTSNKVNGTEKTKFWEGDVDLRTPAPVTLSSMLLMRKPLMSSDLKYLRSQQFRVLYFQREMAEYYAKRHKGC